MTARFDMRRLHLGCGESLLVRPLKMLGLCGEKIQGENDPYLVRFDARRVLRVLTRRAPGTRS